MDDAEQQKEELEALAAIYPDVFHVEDDSRISFRLARDVRLTVTLPKDYPSNSPPQYELSGPYLSRIERMNLQNKLNDECLQNIGGPVLFSWVSTIQNHLSETISSGTDPLDGTSFESAGSDSSLSGANLEIKHGEVLYDRKSNFQAHVASVHNKNEVEAMLRILKSNNKIQRATHNIYAYRFTEMRSGRPFNLHDCEDDGETGASSKMLEMMERMNVNNVMVVVSRWYGGVHLGPDRFRHINNLTRAILVDNNYVKS